jgi:epoxyqueuosine reductase
VRENRCVLTSTDTAWVVARAQALGFDLCGVAAATRWPELGAQEEWLARGYAGEMRYLHDARRADPRLVLPEARSVIVCALNYNTAQPYSTEAVAHAAAGNVPRGWIARYAWGDDYHEILGAKLEELAGALRARFGEDCSARAYVDTGPISERAAARQAGLGWLAKNTCLINEQLGSWLFLGVVITSLELPVSAGHADIPPADLCGNCTLCLDACPTGALVEPYVMDARRCISYLTIELRGSVPEQSRKSIGWQVFGCDICQDVCPWNRQAPATAAAALQPREKTCAPELAWLLALSEDEFREQFRHSAVRRTKWKGLLRNACIAAGNTGATLDPSARELICLRLDRLAASEDATVAEHARWALRQLAIAAQ